MTPELLRIAHLLGLPDTASPHDVVKAAEDAWARGIHTCHDRCTRPRCTDRRYRTAVLEVSQMTDARLRLMCGELTAQEIRSIRAVLGYIVRRGGVVTE